MTLDELIEKLNEMRAMHGGNLRIEMVTQDEDDDWNYQDIEEIRRERDGIVISAI